MEALPAEIFAVLLSFLHAYGYPALFIVGYFAAVLIPLPASTLLIAASAFASQGYLNIYLVFFVTLSANLLGDLTGYSLPYVYGKQALTAIGLRRVVNSKRFLILEDYFRTYPKSLIFFSRFFTEVNGLVNIISGLSQIPFRTFILIEVLGQTFYVLAYSGAGYYLGSSWEDNIVFIERAALLIIGIGVTIQLAQIYLYRSHKRAEAERAVVE